MSQRELCPIPIGWSVRVYRSERENGIAIHARNERGREFTAEMYTDPAPGPIEVTMPDGAKQVITEVIEVNISDIARLAFLWEQVFLRMRDWEKNHGDESKV